MDGVPLAARFSLPTNRRNFCGPADAGSALYRAATEGADVASARAALERFEALMPYLRALGARYDLDPFDARVVEAYWIGNDLLDDFRREDFRTLLADLERHGLPASIRARLERHLPERPLPHHLFHVAFVGVGAVTGHVPTTLPNMEACRPTAARVRSLRDGRLEVEREALVVRGGRLAWAAGRTRQTVPHEPGLVPDPEIGRPVALHWETPVLALDPGRDRALRAYSDRSLMAANEALPALGVLAGFPDGPALGPPSPPAAGASDFRQP